MLSQRALQMKPSAVMALGARAREKPSRGQKVISLALGEPTWPTPQAIGRAGVEAIRAGDTKYTPASGSLKLKESICQNTKKWLGFSPAPEEVTVSIGAKFILFSAIQSLCDPGDEVLVPTPYWVSYPAMVELAGGKLVPLPTTREQDFKLKPEILKQHLSPRSKILILNSPNNPSGYVFSTQELKALSEVLKLHPQLYILSDDIYNHLYFKDRMAPHLLQVCPELREKVVCINAVSKNYSMPGWRVGWAVGHKALMDAMSNFQSQAVSCACSISQTASAFALNHCDKELEDTRQHLIKTKDLALKHFQGIKNLKVFPPEGAFYLWVNVKYVLGLKTPQNKTIHSSFQFVEELFKSQSVLCVPGEAFAYPGYVRIHFAVSEDILISACRRIQKFISSLS